MKTRLANIAATLLLFLVSSTAMAMVWVPTDGDVNTVDFSSMGTGTFGIFDAGALPGAIVPDLALATGADTVVFTLLGDSTWQISNTLGATFNLGLTPEFQIGYMTGGGMWLEELASIELGVPGTNIWVLTWGAGIALEVVDVAPIPIPPAVLLLASGLLGLAGLRRRT